MTARLSWADKGSGIIIWDRYNYLPEARTRSEYKKVYQVAKGNVEDPLIKIIKIVLQKVKNRKGRSGKTLHCLLVNNPNLGRFFYFQRYSNGSIAPLADLLYLIWNITLKIYHAKPRAQKGRSHRKSNNDFLGKLNALPSLPEDVTLCTQNVVDLYSNVSHE